MVKFGVIRVSHSCLLIELDPICNSITASLWFKSCEDHSLLENYNGGLWKTFTRLSPIEDNPGAVSTIASCY